MKPSAVVVFPFNEDFENNCMERATDVPTALVSTIKAWIGTRRGSRLGNMVGCFVPDMVHELVNFRDLSALAKQLKSDASRQFPGVNFVDVTMDLDKSNKFIDLIIKITFSTSMTDIQELQIILPTGVETHN